MYMRRLSALIAVFLSAYPMVSNAQDSLDNVQLAAAEAAAAIVAAPDVETPPEPAAKFWKTSLQTKLDLGQTSLTNWAAGGYNTVSLKTFIDANANYSKGSMFWNNRLQLDYGFLYSADKPILQKTDDRIYLESKWGYQATKNLHYSAEYNFRSQFSNTYDYPTPSARADGSALGENEEYNAADWRAARVLKSGLLSPAYTNLALGLDYKPLKWLTVNFAPITGGFVIVDDPLLRKSYSQPLKKEYEGTAEGDLPLDENGNIDFSSQVVLFSDYLDKPQNLRVNWDNRIDWKIARFFSFTIMTNLIYDDNVIIQTPDDIKEGRPGHQRVQFKESLSFGFVYTFATGN